MVKYRKDDLTILDLEKLYEETSTELRQSTWPRIVARVRSQNIRAEYLGCNQNGMLMFRTNSGTTFGRWWYQEIEFVNMQQCVDMLKGSLLLRKKRVIDMLLTGQIKVNCNCPCWSYYFKYTAWKGGYGIVKEVRPARIRNPHNDKCLCKHLVAVLILLPMVSNHILNDYNKKKIFPTFIERIKKKVTGQ